MKNKKFRPVEVKWVDSAFHSGWSKAETKQREMTVSICHTVGYLISRNKESIKLVMDSADGDMSLGDGIAIPTSAVRYVRYLK